MQLFDSTAKFNGRRSGQFNGRSGGLFNQPAPHGGGTPEPSATSMFYIPVFYIDVSDAAAASYYSHHVNASDTTRGLFFEYRRANTAPSGGPDYIRAIYDCFESEMRPGVVFPFAPDVVSGTATTYTSGNIQSKQITFANTAATRIGWTVPSWVTSTNLTKVLLNTIAGTGNFKLWRDRGGSITEVLGSTAPTGSEATPMALTVSSALQAGDVLLFGSAGFGAGGGGDVFVSAIQMYDPTGSCTDASTQHWVPLVQGTGSRVSVWMQGSTAEGAWLTAPTGQAPAFVGGFAHQAPDGYSSEYPHVETWTKAGIGWTPAGGMWNDGVQLNRVSTVYYDVTYQDTGTLELTYKFDPFGLVVPTTWTANQDLDTPQLYFCMLPVVSTSWATTGCTIAGVAVDDEEYSKAAVQGAGFIYFTAPYATADAAATYMLTTPAGFSMCAYNQADGAATINSRDTENKGTNSVKNYMQLNPTTMANGTSVSGSMVFFQDQAAGPSAASVAAAAALVA